MFDAFLASLPILVVAVFLVGLRWPASRAMPLSLATVVLLALLVWKVPAMQSGQPFASVDVTPEASFGGIMIDSSSRQLGGRYSQTRLGDRLHHILHFRLSDDATLEQKEQA